mmetsp:Transcript_3788/g.5059  ORF Transcript_3788/g.5059 Transcript_3788/m.5059 type:complete len:119 (+) Transcript_3788:2197-2553(+)|eukprot:CAMPEP_0185573492 /NCGR_PEP_ID=MMETSP0434-20130131/5180_1 /TAXON_ID=626734 ORGANISM="Favella taraikaensis, Strain Fe Narragansett Bay" /NCGR_SAMPLE_ID=MMETSP0434 /ASSEMBLY_ACC=CAM_ASM_000379 /LENGTH=118 /DNA_ID=CAMNT_0028189729 /DNA_START=2140 /DNA_END=2496 /DNA_ORIENTATION=+
MNTQLDEAMRENSTLQTKLKANNDSFISNSGGGGSAATESLEKFRAEHELEEHKWNVEKLKLQAQIQELEQTVKMKDQDAAAAQLRSEKNFANELQMQADAYEEEHELLQLENNKVKN